MRPSLMSGFNRNRPCPCGSGKKHKRCHPDMKVRDSFAVIDCREPVAITGVQLLPNGEIRWLANGNQVVPAAAWNEASYARNRKGPKILYRVPMDPHQIQTNDLTALAMYRTLLAVDTNTRVVDHEKVSVGAVVQAELVLAALVVALAVLEPEQDKEGAGASDPEQRVDAESPYREAA